MLIHCFDLVQEEDVCLLVVGDPFAATTHTDLITRCKQMEVRGFSTCSFVRACVRACVRWVAWGFHCFGLFWCVQVPFEVVHNASIMNAIGCCGLQLYNFGKTVSMIRHQTCLCVRVSVCV